jgi:2-dehydro-3-deoxyphosphogluconate aldolase / (4S)-4-hydroxy-2-oxoglutarate aldolase
MTRDRDEVRARIREIGVIPTACLSSADDAHLVADAVSHGGVPIVEVNVAEPGAVAVIADLVRKMPEILVGAGSVLDLETADRCADAGVAFLSSVGLDREVLESVKERGIVVLPGAMTPSEVIAAWRAGADFVKVFPCRQLGGDNYIRILKARFPQIALVASGGVNQQNACDYILAGSAAVGVERELITKEAVRRRRPEQIVELARRFASFVRKARKETGLAQDAKVLPSALREFFGVGNEFRIGSSTQLVEIQPLSFAFRNHAVGTNQVQRPVQAIR